LELASKFCMGRLVAVLEGGYSRSFLGRMATAVIAKMAGIPYPIKDNQPVAGPKIQKRAKKIIEEVKNIQSPFWGL